MTVKLLAANSQMFSVKVQDAVELYLFVITLQKVICLVSSFILCVKLQRHVTDGDAASCVISLNQEKLNSYHLKCLLAFVSTPCSHTSRHVPFHVPSIDKLKK